MTSLRGRSDKAIFMYNVRLESRVIDFIQQHYLLSSGEAAVIGVSGGADSVCLLHLLSQLRNKLDIKLHAAHLDHGLRGAESEADAGYVADVAASLGVPITFDRQDVAAYKADRRCSLEEAAREVRYAFFARVAEEVGAIKVAIGHTWDDQVETVLMHILRGTGTSGLRGLEPCSPIPAKKCQPTAISHKILAIRPLLDITREETLKYCHECRLKPRFDSSNVSLSYFRNRIRLELLPLLRKYNPNIDEAVIRLAEIARDDSIFIEEQAVGLWDKVARQENGVVYLDREKNAILPVALQRQLIRLGIARVLGDIRDIEANHVEAARSLLGKPVGKRFSLPHGLICWGEYSDVVIATGQSLVLSKAKDLSPCPFPPPVSLQAEGVTIPLEVPGETLLPEWRVLASIFPISVQSFPVIATLTETKGKHSQGGGGEDFVAQFDLQKTGTELYVRQSQPGDRFQPLGMDMPKKLHEFMVDAKIPLLWRERIPIVCSPGQIIWVMGLRIDDGVKVTEATKEVLRLEFIRLL